MRRVCNHPRDLPNRIQRSWGGKQWTECYECKKDRERRRYWAKFPHRSKGSHCRHGHAKTPDNLYIDKRGQRCCRICRRAASKRAYDKARAAL